MTYDAALHHVVLFGGQDNNGSFNDTWELISTPTPTPTPSPTHSYTYANANAMHGEMFANTKAQAYASSAPVSTF